MVLMFLDVGDRSVVWSRVAVNWGNEFTVEETRVKRVDSFLFYSLDEMTVSGGPLITEDVLKRNSCD